jgi:hypothetical protein
MLPAIVAFSAVSAVRPPLTTTFSATQQIGQGFGHDGDGCILAESAVQSDPVQSKVWFDAKNTRIAQTNGALVRVDPDPSRVLIGRYDQSPPMEYQLENKTYGTQCLKQTIPPVYCQNGSKTCPPYFGAFGNDLSPFTAILGMYYLNTTLLDSTAEADLWQWESVIPTKVPNGTKIQVMNITRNYTYTVSKKVEGDGTRPLLRFQWTQVHLIFVYVCMYVCMYVCISYYICI